MLDDDGQIELVHGGESEPKEESKLNKLRSSMQQEFKNLKKGMTDFKESLNSQDKDKEEQPDE